MMTARNGERRISYSRRDLGWKYKVFPENSKHQKTFSAQFEEAIKFLFIWDGFKLWSVILNQRGAFQPEEVILLTLY